MQKCLHILKIHLSITSFPPCLACVFFFLRSSFVGGIIHSAARKLECECHVSVHFDQMRALFGCETQTADSSYAGKMSREPPSNTQHSSFVSAIAFEEKMASPRTPALLTGEYVHLVWGGQESTIPLAISLTSPTQKQPKMLYIHVGMGKDCRERLGFPQL